MKVSSVRSVAAKTSSAEFLLPAGLIVPFRGWPPSIMNLGIDSISLGAPHPAPQYRIPRRQDTGTEYLPSIYARHAIRGLPPPLRYLSEDRKSTRLNSSHVAISYAVF